MEASARPEWASRAWLIATGSLVVLVLVVPLLNPDLGGLLVTVILSVLAAAAITVAGWALLHTRSQRRSYEQRLEAWAAERAVQEERLRIARELHDLASHGIGLMTVRASYANLTDDADDAERRQALTDIEQAGRAATAELRQMLTLLRGATPEDVPLRPVATLADLPNIIEDAERSGLRADIEIGDVGEVPNALQATIGAIIREALANTARHAGPTTAHVHLSRDHTTLRVDIRDDGPIEGWHSQAGASHGLAGLRERLALHHGTLTTGPTDTGFRVLAEVPLSPEQQ